MKNISRKIAVVATGVVLTVGALSANPSVDAGKDTGWKAPIGVKAKDTGW